MAPIDLSNKPVKLLMENDVISDTVYEDDLVISKLNFINKKMDVKDPRNFFIVVLNKENSVVGIAMLDELTKMLNKIKEGNDKIKFKEFMVNAICISYKDSIQKALDLLENTNNNILLVTNAELKYVGKIKRTTFKKRLDELISSLAS